MGLVVAVECLLLESAAGVPLERSVCFSRGSFSSFTTSRGGAGGCFGSRVVELVASFSLTRVMEVFVMRRRRPSGVAEGVERARHHAPIESKLFGSLPNLVEHLAVNRYDDGTPRKPGRLFLEVMGSSWIVVLKEPDEQLEMRVVGPTLDDALALAELLLGADDPPWVPDDWARGKGKGKGK